MLHHKLAPDITQAQTGLRQFILVAWTSSIFQCLILVPLRAAFSAPYFILLVYLFLLPRNRSFTIKEVETNIPVIINVRVSTLMKPSCYIITIQLNVCMADISGPPH